MYMKLSKNIKKQIHWPGDIDVCLVVSSLDTLYLKLSDKSRDKGGVQSSDKGEICIWSCIDKVRSFRA